MQPIEISIETSDVLLAVHFNAIMHGAIDASFTLSLAIDDDPPITMYSGIFGEEFPSLHAHFGEFFLNLPPTTHTFRVDLQSDGHVMMENPVLLAHEIGSPTEIG